jgi:hypothetical protein
MERHGLRIKAFRATTLAVSVLLLVAYLVIDVIGRASDFLTSSVFWVLVSVWAVLVVIAVVRQSASSIFEASIAPTIMVDAEQVRHELGIGPALSPPELAGTIICCSGGGIKSASFCLGGLQRLVELKEYTAAHTVVGVSGGGYMAAAFAVLRARYWERLDYQRRVDARQEWREEFAAIRRRERVAQGQPILDAPQDQPAAPAAPPPLEVPPDWVPRFRRLTNYLASSPRVRYDLISSWLLGVAVNLIIIVSATMAIGWVVTELALDAGLVASPSVAKAWEVNPQQRAWYEILALPLILCATSIAYFVGLRLRRNTALAANTAIDRGWKPNLELQTVKKRREGEFRSWSSNFPNALAVIAITYTLLFIVVPYVAVAWEAAAAAKSLGVWDYVWVRAGVVIAGVAGYVSSLRSSLLGFRPGRPDSAAGQALNFFRTRIAPLIALGLYLAGLFVLAVVIDQFMLSNPSARNNPLVWLGWLVPLLLIRVGGTANQTSMYPFYRDRLKAAYLSGGAEDAPWVSRVGSAEMKLSWLEQIPGEPRLVLCGTANVRYQDLVPTGRNGTPFVIGDLVGLTDPLLPGMGCLPTATAYTATARKHRPLQSDAMGPRMTSPNDIATELTVADAVAISGAALSPVDGRDSKTFGRYRVLLAMANVRLGVWLPNPYWVRADKAPTDIWGRFVTTVSDWLDATSPYHVIQEAVGSPSVYSPHLYVTDGGHYDNLGIVEALRRRPERIIMLDGSGDAEDEFPTIGNAIATARMDLGIEIDFRPGPMIRGKRGYPQQAWVVGTATYPDDARCTIIYVKSVLPAGGTWDLQSYQKQHPDFPATSQTFEVFDEFDFEAFRRLGYWVTGAALGKP